MKTEQNDPGGPRGLSRRLLQMMVSLDSSRSTGRRFRAAAGIVGLLGAFGAAGYWLPALVMRFLAR